MKLRPFDYVEPKTVAEAVASLVEYGEKAVVLAGGTNIIPALKNKSMNPGCIINIKSVEGLGEIHEDQEGIHIGALVNLAELAAVKIPRRRKIAVSLPEKVPMMLRKIISLMATPQVRNIATLAGNVAFGSPAADSAPPLLALDALLKVQGKSGGREIPLDEFFLGPGKTALKRGELITEILIPAVSVHKPGGSEKFMKRKANTLAVVSAAVTFNSGNGKTVRDVRIAVGAVAPTPLRIKKAEALLEGQVIDQDLLKMIKDLVAAEISPITDVRSTAWFRKEVTPVLVERCLKAALA